MTALKFHIACCTIFKWVKIYKEKGEEGLLSVHKKPWNRTNSDLEKIIVEMKEHEPGLTVRKAKARLAKQGIRVSIKGIWGIWKRYGYAGFDHKSMSFGFTECLWSKQAKLKYEIAERVFEQGDIQKAAELMNSIPSLPGNEILPQIPDAMLNMRRRVEKLNLLFGKIPVGSYLKQLRNLYRECQRKNLNYSSLIIGLIETMALSWNGEPLKMAKRVDELRNLFKENGGCSSYSLFGPRFFLLTSQGFAYTGLLKIKQASDIARKCRSMLTRRKHIFPVFMRTLGQLYAQLEDFEEAKNWYLKSINMLSTREKMITNSFLADTHVVKGEYKQALEVLRHKELDHWGSRSRMARIKSMWLLTKGLPHRAISLATDVLGSLEKEEAKGSIFGCYFTIASAYCSLGERTRARRILRELLPYLKKNKLHEIKTMIHILITQPSHAKFSKRQNKELLPTIKVLHLLRNNDYLKALEYAKKKGFLGVLHRYVFFFPQAVIELLDKGKPTGLPRTMLNLPVFKKDIPVYTVKFLGRLVVKRKTWKASYKVCLSPKDNAFLIHLTIARNRFFALDRIYKNFWPNSKNPARNLAHLLVRIRKALCLPSHFLYIKGNNLYYDCHFITDYNEFLEHLAKAKAFMRANEWLFARNEYLQAFSLFRGPLFRKMYDNWSEDMRQAILNQLEKELTAFSKASSEHNEQVSDIKILQKLYKILPYSDEIKNFSG
jgi:tetratricopeptide (TPR) repeat protein